MSRNFFDKSPILTDAEISATLSTLRRVRHQLKKRAKDIRAEMRQFAEGIAKIDIEEKFEKFFDVDDFYLSDNIVNSIIREGFGPRTTYRAVSFYLYLRNEYASIYEKEIYIEKMTAEEPFSLAAHNILNGRELSDDAVPKQFAGTFAVYRPSPFAPDDNYLRCRLTIGSDESDFDAKFESADDDRTRGDIEASGKIMPDTYQTARLSVFLGLKGGHGQFMFHFEQVVRFPIKDRIVMRGVLLSALEPAPASAWPVYAISDPELQDFDLRRISKEEAQRDAFLAPALEQFDRGAVFWDKESYRDRKPRP